MKEYQPKQPRLVTWSDLQAVEAMKPDAKRALLNHFATLGSKKRLLVWSIWRQGEKSILASIAEGSDDRRAANALRRKRDAWNDLLFLAAVRIVQNEEYTNRQQYLINDIKTRADEAKRKRYAQSVKQKILRQYDLIDRLHRHYGDWSSVIEAIKRKPKKGEPNPFAELRRENLTAKYLATVISVERKFRE